MTSHDIEQLGVKLYGKNWMLPMSAEIKWSYYTLSRVMNNRIPVSPKLEQAVNNLKKIKRVK